MTKVFADAFFYFALANPSDAAHSRATAFAVSYADTLVTTQWVLTEVADGLARSPRWRNWFVAFHARLVTDPNTRIIPFSAELYTAGLDLYSRRPDKEWSLTDCVSFVVMHRDAITEALTGDRHFEQAGFTPLLK
jgi:predicted nucleic acid-binding protein